MIKDQQIDQQKLMIDEKKLQYLLSFSLLLKLLFLNSYILISFLYFIVHHKEPSLDSINHCIIYLHFFIYLLVRIDSFKF